MNDAGVWGDDERLFGGYAVRGADAVVRVLLPATVETTGEDVTWHAVAADYGRDGQLDGYTSWAELTELPGDGSWAPARRYRPSAGLVSAFVAQRLVDVMQRNDPAPDLWFTEWRRPGAGDGRTLVPPALSMPDSARRASSGDESASGHPAVPGNDVPVGALAAIAPQWAVDGFPGRVWRSDGTVGIAAPAYADSLIVSGAEQIAARLASSDLEAYPVDPWRSLPRLVD